MKIGGWRCYAVVVVVARRSERYAVDNNNELAHKLHARTWGSRPRTHSLKCVYLCVYVFADRSLGIFHSFYTDVYLCVYVCVCENVCAIS